MNIIPVTPSTAIPQIADALMNQESVMLWGPPGCAKSQVGQQIADIYFDKHLIDIRLATTPPEDFHIPVPNMADRCIDWFPTRRMPNVERDGERGLMMLDEITSAPPANSVVGYQFALDRKVGDTALPPGWGVLAAGNRQGDRGVAYAMPLPLSNRFLHFLFDPSHPDTKEQWVKDFASLCAERSINPMVSSFIQFSPKSLFEMPKPGDMVFPTLRAWEKLGKSCDSYEKRGQDVPRETVTGRVGIVHGESFLAYMRHRDEVPQFAEIVSDPEGARCPTAKQLGACFYVVGMLCYHTSPDNFASVSKYLKRLPEEIDSAAVGLLKKETREKILLTRAGQDWLVRVQHLLA